MKKSKRESILIAKHINGFLNGYVPSIESRSDHTLKSHQYALSLYIGFLETEKKIAPEKLCAACFERNIIEEWLLWLTTKRGCGAGTCNNRLASIRVFLKYLGEKEISMMYLSASASNIKRRTQVRKKVRGMSKKAVQSLLSVPDISAKSGRRDLALFITIYSTAARIDEILSLKVEQLHLDASPKPYVTVIGKNSKIRTLYLLPKAVAHLKKYLHEYHGNAPDKGAFLFYSRNKGPFGMISQTAISKRLSIHAAAAHRICDEVPLGLTAHQLRHAKASHWLEDGMNIVQISFLLGHEQLETTMIYLDISTEEESKALATLEDENDKTVSKKWKNNSSNLAGFCGVKPMKQ